MFLCILFLVELEFEKCWFLRRGEKERTNNKLDPHMASEPGFEPGPHWWGGKEKKERHGVGVNLIVCFGVLDRAKVCCTRRPGYPKVI